jgi:ABC-type lipoprotein export system ATPase subunit
VLLVKHWPLFEKTAPAYGGRTHLTAYLSDDEGETWQLALDHWRGRNVGLVPQRLHLVAALDVGDNLRLARHLAGLPEDAARIAMLLAAVGVDDLADRYPRQLSQGQAQRVAIARAVVNRPALLLADEPTANLDDAHAAAALQLLRSQAIDAGGRAPMRHSMRQAPLRRHLGFDRMSGCR